MNSGEHLWMIPTGETPEIVLNHPDLKGKDIPNIELMCWLNQLSGLLKNA